MKPVIGISCSFNQQQKIITLKQDYSLAIVKNGGLPVLIPRMDEKSLLEQYSIQLDGLLLSGGGDIDPALYQEQRIKSHRLTNVDPEQDRFEIALFRYFLKEKKPILAICRGMQILNVGLGGTLYQDLSLMISKVGSHQSKYLKKDLFHQVNFKEGTKIAKILGKTRIVNSHHHQAVKKLGQGLIVSGHSTDGVVEAIELEGEPWVVGVQWHPERLTTSYAMSELFRVFLQQALIKRESY
ncbi:MAG TPA: gamma-glutamyl-gamma-aminobutyrate hydrolase family protein [Bacillota bacterium]|jgi:putative glutamine amidotransferase|nr:gamma-glutamyl-gamma-aminobutyrate hydrolase family protein [Bacillota bacterium]HOL08894.1 gamma-glutamyl-gamma-aminobutyrate hydrolase family protein [Bacillota bacterium]HPO96587.1 gamma-glutamyl-gamma-aminobutyrate hydrolase family protein [Bacillota bacterium]